MEMEEGSSVDSLLLLMLISSASCHYANVTLPQAPDREEEEEEEEDTRLIKGTQTLHF